MARFGKKSRWESNVVRVRYGCGMWKSINALRYMFWNHICLKVGFGREIKFWEDRWVGDVPLNDTFSVLFGLTLDLGGMVNEFFDYDRNCWSPRFRQNFNDWEMDEMCSLLRVLNGIKLNNSLVDDWRWVLNKKEFFRLSPFIWRQFGIGQLSFPIKPFGISGFLLKLLFSFGLRFWIKFSL